MTKIEISSRMSVASILNSGKNSMLIHLPPKSKILGRRLLSEKVKKLLEIPEDYKIISLLPLGYAISEVQSHDKKKLDEVLYWEKFHSK